MRSVRGLVCFDLDGTLLRGPTVCEVLATPLGRLREMQRFEAFKSEQEIMSARMEMSRWYGASSTRDLAEFCKDAQFAPGAKEAIAQLQADDIEVAIASITWKFAVSWFAERLNIHHYVGTELMKTGEIKHVWGRTKGAWLRALVRELAIPETRTAAVGDSASDAELLRAANLRFFVGHELPAGFQDTVHMPAADIRDVANKVIDAWKSSAASH